MTALSLRADAFDGPAAITYRVLGLKGQDSAILKRDRKTSTWKVLLGEVGGALKSAGLAFSSLGLAIAFLEKWTETGGSE